MEPIQKQTQEQLVAISEKIQELEIQNILMKLKSFLQDREMLAKAFMDEEIEEKDICEKLVAYTN